jgi:ubiquinone/menaquinone biosynthesis C-methylase UbiE
LPNNEPPPAPPRFDRSGLTAYFDRLANSYGEGEYFRRRREAGRAAIAAEIAAARSILDLGCGPGAYLQDLVRTGVEAKIVGADLSLAMMAEARRRVGARVAFVRADATFLPFKSESWDLVVCSHVLQFVTDLDECLRGIARGLRAGGVIVTTLEDSAMAETLGAIMPVDEWQDFRRAVLVAGRAERGNRPGDSAYSAAFAQAGLEPEFRVAPFSVRWPDIEEWVRVRWMPVASEAGREHIERILARLRNDPRVTGIELKLSEKMLLGRKP